MLYNLRYDKPVLLDMTVDNGICEVDAGSSYFLVADMYSSCMS